MGVRVTATVTVGAGADAGAVIDVVGTLRVKGVERVEAVTAPEACRDGWACAIGIVRVPDGDELIPGVASGSSCCATSAVTDMNAATTPAMSAAEIAPPSR